MAFLKMTRTIVNNLVGKPATRVYPVEKRASFPHTRGKISIMVEGCIFCGLCQRKCPSGAIEINKGEKRWTIDPFSCVNCNVCVDTCPKKVLLMNNGYTTPACMKVREEYVDARVFDNAANN
ncbi:MAG: 4Fe-4S dicluster domain-containing protein [Bacillota bacterium]|jgi:ech hydrogenase subunit F